MLEISKELGLAHIGSCLSVLPILEDIYKHKKPNDKVILDGAHAHLAHLLVMEKYSFSYEIKDLINQWGIHCDRRAGCDASGGSLGHGLGIAIGMALAGYPVHVIVTDGSICEGSNWEALRIIHDLKLYQTHIYCNFNGYTAVSKYSSALLEKRMKSFVPGIKVYHTKNGKGFEGLQGHYKKL